MQHRFPKSLPSPNANTPGNSPARAPTLPLGALAAGFGLLHAAAVAQTTLPAADTAASPPAATAPQTTLQPISVKAKVETDANSVRAATTGIGKGQQDLRDVPQSLTVVTEKLIDDRRVDTLKEALHYTAGISFQAAEGGEEDIRLRGFSMATSGDIYADGLRDPAFYERDTFNHDRVELLRGSASMLFGRGSTGGVVNQANKQAFLGRAGTFDMTAGSGEYVRATADLNARLGESTAVRLNVMRTAATNHGNRIDKEGAALNWRTGIGERHEFEVSGYWLRNDNGVNYGLPWLRADSAQANANPSGPMTQLNPANYYGAASDYNAGGANHLTVGYTQRFAGGGEWKTRLRHGLYERDMRASTIRFCVAPTCAGFTVPGATGSSGLTDATPLTRGTNNKIQDLETTTLQSDFSRRIQASGLRHEVLAGADLALESFKGYATALPAGVTLNKNTVRTTIGTPNDGTGWVDEALRLRRQQAGFEAKALGLYAQDLVQITPTVKLLAGLRYDRFKGDYRSYATAVTATTPVVGAETAARGRSDGLWSKRFGALYQPNDDASFHISYGTSFNTSGDTYQYDLPGSNTPPEGSRNIELGAKVDLFNGRLSSRVALFHATKTHERNRDSPAGTPLEDYLLSGQRHAAGFELDLAGRITAQWEVYGSYAWIPVAKIDKGNADGTTLTGEQVGQRPSMTPRHSGTVWSTYQFMPRWRAGGGLNARSAVTPNRNPAGVVAPRYITADMMLEYTASEALALKLNLLNATNKHYADSLYSGHYVPGAARALQMTLTSRF